MKLYLEDHKPKLAANTQQVPKPVLDSFPLMSLEPSEERLKRTIKMTPLFLARTILIELRMPLLLRQRINLYKKRDLLTNKKPQLWPSQWLRRRRWSKWINKELKKLSHQTIRSTRARRMRHYSQRPRNNSITRWMTSNKWTKWFSTPRLSLLEINNLWRTNVLSLNGLKSRRNLILWWKLKDLRSFKKKKKEKLEKCTLESRVLKSSLIRFKRELFREWRNKKSVIRKRSSSKLTFKKWEKKMRQLMKLRELRSTFLCNKQLKPMLNLSWKKLEENKRNRAKTIRSESIREIKIRKNSKLNKKLKDLEKKKSAKFKDLENFKRRPLIDKLKLMLWEPREHSRKVREMPEKEKSSRQQRDKEFRPIWRLLDRNNSKKKHPLWLNKQELKEKITCIKFKSRNKLSSKKEKLRRIEDKP